MEFVSKVNDILILEDDCKYFVKERVSLNGNNYLFLQKASEHLSSIASDENNSVEIVKEFVDENNEYYLEAVTDVVEKKNIVDNALNKN